MLFIAALLPIAVLMILIIVFRRSVVLSAAVALLAMIGIGMYWGVESGVMLAASLRGLFVAAEIIVIVAAALLIVKVVSSRGLFRQIETLINSLSGDYRVQTMLVSFGVVYFIEGVAGFGTPAVVAVPIFMALGFKAVHSVTLALIATTIPVSFGAVGLPVLFGIGSPLQAIAEDPTRTVNEVAAVTAGINIFLSVILALLLCAVAVRLRNGRLKYFVEFIPFAALSGLAVAVPSFIAATLFGPELPSIAGGIVGVTIIAFLAHHNIAIPADAAAIERDNKEVKAQNRRILFAEKYIWKSISPYILLIGLLLLTRLPYLPIGDALRKITIGNSSILGSGIGYSVAPLFSVAFILAICAAFAVVVSWKHLGSPKRTFSEVLTSVRRPFLALLLVLVLVQIFIYSGTGVNEPMPLVIAQTLSNFSGGFWPFIAPFIGALGAFVAGSATVSNLVFSGLQYDIAQSLNYSPVVLLALQNIGAGIGNMVALHNVIAALAIAGLGEHYSHKIIRNNLTPLFIMLAAAGFAGLLLTA